MVIIRCDVKVQNDLCDVFAVKERLKVERHTVLLTLQFGLGNGNQACWYPAAAVNIFTNLRNQADRMGRMINESRTKYIKTEPNTVANQQGVKRRDKHWRVQPLGSS